MPHRLLPYLNWQTLAGLGLIGGEIAASAVPALPPAPPSMPPWLTFLMGSGGLTLLGLMLAAYGQMKAQARAQRLLDVDSEIEGDRRRHEARARFEKDYGRSLQEKYDALQAETDKIRRDLADNREHSHRDLAAAQRRLLEMEERLAAKDEELARLRAQVKGVDRKLSTAASVTREAINEAIDPPTGPLPPVEPGPSDSDPDRPTLAPEPRP